jgi:hypothetical protein
LERTVPCTSWPAWRDGTLKECFFAQDLPVRAEGAPGFSSHSTSSEDIKSIFCTACDQLGVRWTGPNWMTIAVSRRPDVAKLDAIIGPKR